MVVEFRRKRAAIIDLMSVCNIVFFICFVVAPICGYYMFEDWLFYSVMRYTYKGIQYGEDSFFLTGGLVILGYLFFLFFYFFSKSPGSSSSLNNFFGNKIPVYNVFVFALVILLLSILAFSFESVKAGGPLKWMISNPRLYHAGDADDIESNSWLADKFIRLSIMSSYLLWGVLKALNISTIVTNLKNNKGLIRCLLLISILLSTAVVIHAGGRFLLFQYFAVFFIANLIFSSKRLKILPVLTLVFFGSIVLLYGRTFFKIFIYEDALSVLDGDDKTLVDYLFGVINNYTFPFFAFNNNLIYPNSSISFFADFFLWPLNFLPSSVRPDLAIDSTAINTYRLMGEYKRFIPTDIFSYGFINFGYLGALITSALFGFIVKKINWILFKENPISVILYVSIAFLIGFRIMYFDPYHFFKGSFETLGCLIIIAYFNYGKSKKKVL